MIDDTIMEEIRTHRKMYAAQFNYDVAAIVADLLEMEKKTSHPVINRLTHRINEDQKANTHLNALKSS